MESGSGGADFLGFKQMMDGKKRLHSNGSEYWLAREIQESLGYDKWEKFEHAITRAMKACKSAGYVVSNHFRGFGKMVRIGSGAERSKGDYYLSRLACHLIAMNGDPRKPEIGLAQAYFAIQSRRAELGDEMRAKIARLEKRHIVTLHNKELFGVAKKSGVSHFGVFQDRGISRLYGMNTKAVKAKKKIPENETILDYAGIAELSANDFRITLTTATLAKHNIRNEHAANAIHERVSGNIREAMQKSGDIMPEELPAEPHIKQIEREIKASKQLPPKGEES